MNNQQAIDRLMKHIEWSWPEETIDAIGMGIHALKETEWIPCSERLPEVPEGTDDDECPEFNVMIKGANRATTLRCAPDGTWFDEFGHVYPVIFWQPLPEPYKEQENG